MTPTQQQMARDLAEKVMGLRIEMAGGSASDLYVYHDGMYRHYPNGSRKKWNPFTSRDDCAELLGRVTDEQQQGLVLGRLANIVAAPGDPIDMTPRWLYWAFLHATPAQISEAVWRATCQ